jgi:pantetheine-phosphate adenylyltransferase
MPHSNIIVYPGTFDPMTLGHLDLLTRGAALFDRVVLAVAGPSTKTSHMFDCDERIEMAREVTRELPNVDVRRMDGMLIDFVRSQGARVILRGLRAYSDFEYEFQMALTNRKLAPEIETLFLMPKEDLSYVSSSTVREVARYAGDTSRFVPPAVQRHIERRVVIDRLLPPEAPHAH